MDVTPEMVRAAQEGDPAAMEDLIAGSYRAAYTLALRLMGNPDDASEATQEAYIRMVRGLKKFREVGAFPTWLFKIVSNVCMTEMRKRSRRDVPTEIETMEDPAPQDAEDTAIGRVFWKKGDGATIDGFGPDGIAARAQDLAGVLSRFQSGYLYHYAFVMLIGVAALVTYFMLFVR